MIEVGEYVRTKKKGIFKVLSIRKTPYGYYCGTVDNDNIRTFTIGKGGNAEIKKDIVKHSKNIIDLIEVGDIVTYDSNNYGLDIIEVVVETCKVDEDYDEGEGFICTAYDDYIRSKSIKSIVTKEQFKNIEYIVKE